MMRFYPADDGCTYLQMWIGADGRMWSTCVSHIMCEEYAMFRDGTKMMLKHSKRDLCFLNTDKARYKSFTSDATGMTYRVDGQGDITRNQVIAFLKAYESNQTKPYYLD